MSDKLLLHPNQRIDKVDLDYAASGYTDAVIQQDHREILQGSSPYALHGFRIELGTLPGEVTVHNGAYLDEFGKLVTNDESVEASQTITLLGANSTFYLEISYQESPTDLDDKAFWDPTFDNGAGNLKGKEYVQEVNTRISTIWSVSYSSSGFTGVDDSGNSYIPLAILNTDSLGNITSSVNPGLVTAPYSTVLAEDANAGDTLIKVIDAVLLLENSDHILIGTENKIIDTVDRERGLVTVTTGLASAKKHGTIVQNVGGPQYIVPRTTAHVEYVEVLSTHPDKLKRFYAGDESRGEAIIASPFTTGQRTDFQIETLKDHVDFLAHQLREMKVGSTAPFPSNISTIRYYDYAGSIQGSKTVSFTIGTGVGASVGDFNGETEVPFQQAIATAIASGLSSVVIFVKNGTYAISTPIASAIPVTIVGEATSGSDLNVILAGTSVTTAMFSPTTALNLYNVYLDKATVSTTGVIAVTSSSTLIGLHNVKTSTLFTPLISIGIEDRAYTIILDVDQSSITCGGTVPAVIYQDPNEDGVGYIGGSLRSSSITVSGANTHFANVYSLSNFRVEGIQFISQANGSFATSDADNVHIYASKFLFTAANATGGVLVSTTGGLNRTSVSDNEVTYYSAGNGAKAFYVIYAIDSSMRNNVIAMTYNAAATGDGIVGIEVAGSNSVCSNFTVDSTAINLGIGKVGACIAIHNCTPSKITIKGCALSGGNSGVYIFGLTSFATELGRTSISIESNTYRGGNYDPGATLTTQHFGVYVTELPEVIDLNINSNNIVGLRGSSRAIGIYLRNQTTTASTVRSKINVQFNGIKQIGRPTADEADQCYGIQVGEFIQYTDVRVTGNQIDSIFGTEAAGIHTFSTGTNICENAVFSDNSISNVICYSVAAGHSAGIVLVAFASTAEISNNIITTITDASASSSVEGVQIGSSARVAVYNNQLVNCVSRISGVEYGINITDSIGNFDNNRIIGSFFGIKFTLNTVQAAGVSISGNLIGASVTTAPRTGIEVSVAAAASLNSCNISNNIITNLAAATIAQGILVKDLSTNSSGMSVSNNMIKEVGAANPGSAIYISNIDNVIINSNHIYGSTAGHSGTGLNISRAGIKVENCQGIEVSSNYSSWNINFPNGIGASTQGEFRFMSSGSINVIGNRILGAMVGIDYVAITMNSVFYINAMSNYFVGSDPSITEQWFATGGGGNINIPASVNYIGT